ncbi:MAG: hypothetical protein AB7J28_12765 [Hyphomonadaceae bacterium]
MDDFDADLKRAFASLEDPADNGFTAAVAHRVERAERAQTARAWLNQAAYGVAGGALAYGLVSIGQAVGPSMLAQLGLDFAQFHAAVATGSQQALLGAGIVPLVLAAIAGIGGVAAARTIAE